MRQICYGRGAETGNSSAYTTGVMYCESWQLGGGTASTLKDWKLRKWLPHGRIVGLAFVTEFSHPIVLDEVRGLERKIDRSP